MDDSDSCSIVEYFAEHEGYRCGYCKSPNTCYSHGMWAHCLTVQDYQDLIDRGWRRSGKYCYKPTMNLTCCPQYTIRCDVTQVKLSKSQKNVIKKVNKYLVLGKKKDDEKCGTDSEMNSGTTFAEIDAEQQKARVAEMKLAAKNPPKVLPRQIQSAENATNPRRLSLPPSTKYRSCTTAVIKNDDLAPPPTTAVTVSTKKFPKPGEGADASKPPCKKAKQLRLQRREDKSNAKLQQGIRTEERLTKAPQNAEKTIEEFLTRCDHAEAVNKLKCTMVRSNPPSTQLTETLEESYAVYKKYQEMIHNDPPEKCKMSQFKRFLVDSPLESHFPAGGPPCGYGSFHQQYWLNGKLVAVGVVDILPRLVSSVYFYYDPDCRFLSLGTYASLREIALTREFYRHSPDLRFYYMGFYIHSCPKMRYKGQYHPSYLLCPEVYTWHAIEKCTPKLDVVSYARLSPDKNAGDALKGNLSDVQVLHEHKAVPYVRYKAEAKSSDDAEVRQYLEFVGAHCARRMLLYR